MPLNATTYLERHGWRGKGVPLDGEKGRGLKKPLAIPMKRNLKGVGKERDRAVEWWDCLFEAGAKKIQSPSQTKTKDDLNEPKSKSNNLSSSSSSVSLATLAKREYARKLLMSGFVRGKPNDPYEDQMKDIEIAVAEQDRSRLEAKAKLAKELPMMNGNDQKSNDLPPSDKDEEKIKRKEAKRIRKEEEKMLKKAEKSSKKESDGKSKDKENRKKRKREEKESETIIKDEDLDIKEKKRVKKAKKETKDEIEEKKLKKEERRKEKKTKSEEAEKASKKSKSNSESKESKTKSTKG